MTELKVLGKKPPKITIVFPEVELTRFELCKLVVDQALKQTDNYREALLEAADELEKRCPKRYRKVHTEEDEKICYWCGLAKRLRISAG